MPQGGSVVGGGAAIGLPTNNKLTITQSSQNAIINWNSFSIGAPNTVIFNQPGAGSAILNRVTGNTPSTIAGLLQANGQVYLVNPNGIAITSSGAVDVGGGFVASTLGISNDDFMGGIRTFTGSGNSAPVSNAGKINIGTGGFAALLGGTVSNEGRINVPLGKVGIGSGESITLDIAGDGFMQVAVPTAATASNGKALIDIAGRIKAAGGMIEIKAASVKQAIRNVVNVSGKLSARSVSGRSGAIVLNGGDGGNVTVAGRLNASAGTKAKSTNGGMIAITGNSVTIADKARIKAVSKNATGGAIEVTGDNVSVNGGLIDASGARGGSISIISSGNLAVSGTVLAIGSAAGQSGGFVETSGHAVQVSGRINAGRGGTWLLDPNDLTIDSTLAGTINAALNAGTNVTEQTTALGTGGSGDITVANALTWSTNALLTLSAYRNINVNSNITSSGGGAVKLYADNSGTGTGTVSFGIGNQVSTSGAVSIFYNPTGNNPSTVNASSYTSPTNYAADIANGGTLTGYMLVNTVYDLQNVKNNLSGAYALGSNIDAAATSTWNANSGFTPIGTVALPFNGTFDGLEHAISNLTINLSAVADIGLFGSTGTGSVIQNVGLIGGSVLGLSSAGGLVGSNTGTISNSYNTGTVSGGSSLGGLMGSNTGTVSGSYATGNVTGTSSLGGLMGSNTGTVSGSFATGNITGTSSLGGLMGSSTTGPVSNSYATGNVSGTSSVGGLMGSSTGPVIDTYATGAVSGTTSVGGLMGSSSGVVTNSYWNTQTSGQPTSPGGTPLTSAEMLQSSNFTAWDFANTWTMTNGVTNPLLRSFITPLTVTANNAIKTYDGLAYSGGNGVTYSTTPNGTLLGTVSYSGTAQGAVNAGGYVIAPSGLSSTGQLGYVISYVNGTLDVAAAALTVTADAQSRAYGAANPGLTYVSAGLVNGDTLSGLLATAAGASSNVGSYAITQGTLAASANYALSYVGANLGVTAAALTVTADAQSRAYGAANPGLTYVSAGLVNGDTLSGLLATTAGASSNVGSYAITQGTLAPSANYALSYVANTMTVSGAVPMLPDVSLVNVSADPTAFPSYFILDSVPVNPSNDSNGGYNAYASADLATNYSVCTPAGVVQNLNRYGRVELIGEIASSCNGRNR